MEILATAAFLSRAHDSRDALRATIRHLEDNGQIGGTLWLPDRRILGYSHHQRGLALWYLAESTSVDQRISEPLLAALSKSELRGLGVCESAIPKVQQACSINELKTIPLDSAISESLIFLWLQKLHGIKGAEEELKFRAPDLDHFDRFLRGDITQLLLNLDQSQRRIVDLKGAGPLIIRGVAGSGKTAIALHRIVDALRQKTLFDSAKILFLAYNRSLIVTTKELLAAKGLRPDDLEVSTIHRWCKRFAGPNLRVTSEKERQELIEAAVSSAKNTSARSENQNSTIWSFPRQFWFEEIHRIKGAGLTSLESYLAFHRHGAGRPLDQKPRRLVWSVLQIYTKTQQTEQCFDWDDIINIAVTKVAAMGKAAPCYDQVIVDEAQDLTISALRLAALLAKPEGTLLISYDSAQSIYERGFRWKSCGIKVSGARSFDLKKNYRNTEEILESARPLLLQMRDNSDLESPQNLQGSEEVLQPDSACRRGPRPYFLSVQFGHEYSATANAIASMIVAEKIPPQNIAILCFPNRARDRMVEELKRARIRHQLHDSESVLRLADPSVKVLPIKSAKGLEFPVVFLLGSGAFFRPFHLGDYDRADWDEQMKRCLYMAMTRAMTRLVIVHDRNDPPPFLELSRTD